MTKEKNLHMKQCACVFDEISSGVLDALGIAKPEIILLIARCITKALSSDCSDCTFEQRKLHLEEGVVSRKKMEFVRRKSFLIVFLATRGWNRHLLLQECTQDDVAALMGTVVQGSVLVATDTVGMAATAVVLLGAITAVATPIAMTDTTILSQTEETCRESAG